MSVTPAKNPLTTMLSPKAYAQSTDLEPLLNKVVNQCYLTQSSCPAAVISGLLHSTYTLDILQEIRAESRLNGEAGHTAEITITLVNGVSASTVVSHSNATAPFHPNTCRVISHIPAEVLRLQGPGSISHCLGLGANGQGSNTTARPQAQHDMTTKQNTAIIVNSPTNSGGNSDSGLKGSSAVGALLPLPNRALYSSPSQADAAQSLTAEALHRATKFDLSCPIYYLKRYVAPVLEGKSRVVDQFNIDDSLARLDPSGNFSSLLGQVAGAMSLCVAKAAAQSLNWSLFKYVNHLVQIRYGNVSTAGHSNQSWLSTIRNNIKSGTSLSDTHMSSPSQQSYTALQTAISKNGQVLEENRFSIPNLVITLFGTDPRAMGKVRVREVCLVVNLQDNTPVPFPVDLDRKHDDTMSEKYSHSFNSALNGQANHLNESRVSNTGRVSPDACVGHVASAVGSIPPKPVLTPEILEQIIRIGDVANAKASQLLASILSATQGGKDHGAFTPEAVEATMIGVNCDGSTKFPFFTSIRQMVELVEAAINEVVYPKTYSNDNRSSSHTRNDDRKEKSKSPTPTASRKSKVPVSISRDSSSPVLNMSDSGEHRRVQKEAALAHSARITPVLGSIAPTPPLFTVGLVVDGALCRRSELYDPMAGKQEAVSGKSGKAPRKSTSVSGKPRPSSGLKGADDSTTSVVNPSQSLIGKYSLVQGDPELSGEELAETLSTLVNKDKVGVVTYLEDTHGELDLLDMQRLMSRCFATPAKTEDRDPSGAEPAGGLSSGLPAKEEDASNSNNECPVSQSLPPPPPMPSSSNVIIAGHHLYSGNPKALIRGAKYTLTNHAVLRLNDCGTLTRLLDYAKLFTSSYPGASIGLSGEMSEGDGAALAHLAVGLHVRTLRTGGLYRSSNTAILNELLSISDALIRDGLVAKRGAVYDTRLMAMPVPPPVPPSQADALPTDKTSKSKRK